MFSKFFYTASMSSYFTFYLIDHLFPTDSPRERQAQPKGVGDEAPASAMSCGCPLGHPTGASLRFHGRT